jgi:hypothetical protein
VEKKRLTPFLTRTCRRADFHNGQNAAGDRAASVIMAKSEERAAYPKISG